MMPTGELDEARIDLEKAKEISGTKLRSLETVYRKNQIDAIMEMGKEISGLHQKYSKTGQKHRWKAEFCDLQLRTSRRTAERYRKIYNAFNDCPTLWKTFKLCALVELAEFADRKGRRNGSEAAATCLQYIRTIAVNWDGVIRRADAVQYCQAWEKFADRPELLKWFTFDALKLLIATGDDSAISQAKYAAEDLNEEAATGNAVEPIGLDQAQAIIENFAGDTAHPNETQSLVHSELAEFSEDSANFEEEDSAEESDVDDDSDVEADAYDEVDEPMRAIAPPEISDGPAPSRRKFVKTYKLSKCDISIASDIEPATPEDIEIILDELRVIMQAAFESELASAK
jgi:hypothetical protein